MTRHAWFATVVVAMGALAAACGGDRGATGGGTPAPSVPLAAAETTTVTLPADVPAQLYVEHDAYVYARSTGVVESVYVDLGTPVRHGQKLAQLEDIDQTIALKQAENALPPAQHLAERYRQLAVTGAVTPADSEQAESSYQKALLTLRQARRDFNLTRIVAPFAGVVTARTVRVGWMVRPGDSLFRVSALHPLLASARVPEENAMGIHVGDSAEVVAENGRTVPASVLRASPALDPASGTREVIVRLAAHSGLLPGASVHVRVGAARRTVLAIPDAAIGENGQVLVWEDGRELLRSVTLGRDLGEGRREVVAGLSPGERVVLAKR